MMTRKKCYDRNECKYNDGRGPCDHECKNTEGSFLCRCDPGYELDENNTSCNDIEECAIENGGCSHTCVEEEGSYHCECPEGYELGSNDATCVDIDECSGSHGCSYACSNYDGGYQCTCKRGQKLDVDQKTCIDINEVYLELSRDSNFDHDHFSVKKTFTIVTMKFPIVLMKSTQKLSAVNVTKDITFWVVPVTILMNVIKMIRVVLR